MVGGIGYGRIILVDKRLRPDLMLPSPFLQCEPHLTPGGSGVMADPDRRGEEFRKAWPPLFCCSGQREASHEEFAEEVDGWLLLLPVISLLALTGETLADVVRRKGRTAGSLDGWGLEGDEGSSGLRVFFPRLRGLGFWPDVLLDAKIAIIPKADGDATPLGQRAFSVLPVVYRVWASACMVQLESWFRSWVPESVYSAGGGRSFDEAW